MDARLRQGLQERPDHRTGQLEAGAVLWPLRMFREIQRKRADASERSTGDGGSTSEVVSQSVGGGIFTVARGPSS